jgi:hypothetical protein
MFLRRGLIFLIGSLLLIGCNADKSTMITAQVAKNLSPESNTATVIAGRTAISNFFIDQPSDTSSNHIFPAWVEPVTGASVKINDISLAEKVEGVYFQSGFDLQYVQRYNLYITTEKETINGSCVLPDSFSIAFPNMEDTILFYDAMVDWTTSDSAEHYIIEVEPVDQSNKAMGWTKDFPPETTSCIIPQATFMDTVGDLQVGKYSINLSSFNGAWKKGSWKFFPSGGNLSGAPGLFGGAVYAKSIVVYIKGM